MLIILHGQNNYCTFVIEMSNIRLIAEWEECDAILMAWPTARTDWDYILPEAQEQYLRLIKGFISAGERVVLLAHNVKEIEALWPDYDKSKLAVVEADYNDTWTRDYGPMTVDRYDRRRALDFGFNAWGLKFAADKDNMVNLSLTDQFIFRPEAYRNHRSYVLEGGSVDTDGQGTILTTTRCLCSPNRNGGLSKDEVNAKLNESLGADHILWLDYGSLAGDDTDSHIDTLARMCPDNIILFTGCRDESDPHFETLLKMRAQLSLFRNAEGQPYNLLELPLPAPVYDEDGKRLPATYANYLITPRNIFMPIYGDTRLDMLACQTVKIAFPNHNVVPIDCKTLLKQHGSLHCATMQLPEGVLVDTLFI